MRGDLFDNHPLPICLFDADFRLIDLNPAYTQMTGLRIDDVRGEHGILGHTPDGRGLIHPDDVAKVLESLRTTAEEPRRNWPASYTRTPSAGGGYRWIGTFLSTLDAGPSGVRHIVALRDAGISVAVDALMDAVVEGAGPDVIVARVIETAQASGHYVASVHHRRGFVTGAVTDVVVGPDWLPVGAAENVVAAACDSGTKAEASLSEIGLPEPYDVDGRSLVHVTAFPFTVKGEPAGALCAWHELYGIGWQGAEFLARTAGLAGRAITNRIDADGQRPVRTVGELTVDLVQRTATVNDRTVRVTPIEVTILDLLTEVPGRAVTRSRIMTRLFGSTYAGGERSCDAHVRNLRSKLGDEAGAPRLIATIRGAGYALVLG